MENTELKSVIETLNGKIDSFRSEVESVKGSDVVTETKLKKMEADLAETLAQKSALETRLSALEAAGNRPGSVKNGVEVDEHKEAFVNYLRKPFDSERKSAFEQKSVNTTTGPTGQLAVPSAISSEVYRVVTERVKMRQLARVVQVGTPDFTALVNNANAGATWVGELDVRPQTDAPTLDEVGPVWGEMSASVEISLTALEDMVFDPAAWVTAEIAAKFALAEEAAFIAGDSAKKPKGLLDTTGRAIGNVKTGVAGAFSANPYDDLIKLKYSLKDEHREKGVFLLNSATLATLMTVKNTAGDYIYRDSPIAGQPATLSGSNVVVSERIPSVAANSRSVVFADMYSAYIIHDRIGFSVVVDPYSKDGFLLIKARKRVSGNIFDTNAAKALQFAV